MAPATPRMVSGSRGLEPGLGALRRAKTCASVPYAVTMPLGTTTGCGPVKAARPSSSAASRVGVLKHPPQLPSGQSQYLTLWIVNKG